MNIIHDKDETAKHNNASAKQRGPPNCKRCRWKSCDERDGMSGMRRE